MKYEALLTDFEFSSHGISLLQDPNSDTVWLAAINHLNDGSVIERFDHVPGQPLKHIKTIRDPLIVHPNNLLLTGPDAFYVSNDHGANHSVWRRVEDFWRRPWSNVVYYEDGQSKVAASGVVYANGLDIDGDKIWLVSSTSRRLNLFERKENNGLRMIDFVDLVIKINVAWIL